MDDFFERKSICCGKPVYHPFPMAGSRLEKALSLRCSACGAVANEFEVYDFAGNRIWPVPDWFVEPEMTGMYDLVVLFRKRVKK